MGFTEEMAIKEAKRCLRCDLDLKEQEAEDKKQKTESVCLKSEV